MSERTAPMSTEAPRISPSGWLWDVFCRVIDNHGDLGVCWRLSVDLAQRGHRVRLWVDDASALAWMAPRGQAGVHILPWSEQPLDGLGDPGDVTVEAFGCEIPASYQQTLASMSPSLRPATDVPGPAPAPRRVWINLEYLSAEPHVEHLHGLPSPVLAGPGRGLTKWFFYPGFTPRTGGLIREPHLPAPGDAANARSTCRISLFCYEPPGLGLWLKDLANAPLPIRLWVTSGRAGAAVRASGLATPRPGQSRARNGSLHLSWLNYLSQGGYDGLLRACQLNCVRGEDSLVRAIWAGRPFVWQLYPQDDHAHLDKLEAFLHTTDAPAFVAAAHRAWNADQPAHMPELSLAILAEWQAWARSLRQRLCAQDDLVTQLVRFVAAKR